jgi:hypothetical protein
MVKVISKSDKKTKNTALIFLSLQFLSDLTQPNYGAKFRRVTKIHNDSRYTTI